MTRRLLDGLIAVGIEHTAELFQELVVGKVLRNPLVLGHPLGIQFKILARACGSHKRSLTAQLLVS